MLSVAGTRQLKPLQFVKVLAFLTTLRLRVESIEYLLGAYVFSITSSHYRADWCNMMHGWSAMIDNPIRVLVDRTTIAAVGIIWISKEGTGDGISGIAECKGAVDRRTTSVG
jgi:hypothetical protein